MKSLGRSMLMRLHRAVLKAEQKLERDEALCVLDLKHAKGPSEVRFMQGAVKQYRMKRTRDRMLTQLITGELEKYFAAKYIREAKKNGDDTNIATVCEYARQEAALVLKFLL